MIDTFLGKYYEIVREAISNIYNEENENIEKAARLVAEATMKDKLIHVFGTGHSMIIAEELFLRAGGLVNVNAILAPDLSIHKGIVSSVNEKTPGIAEKVLSKYNLSEGDIFIVVSVSGVNAAPVEAANIAKQKGCKVIAITSVEESSKLKPRNPLGKRLYEIADIVIDNKVPYGDAVLQLPDSPIKAVPVSTIASAFAANSIVAKAIEIMIQKGFKPPVWVSGNIPESDKINMQYVDKLIGRIKHLGIEELMLKLSEEKKEEVKVEIKKTKSILVKGRILTPFNEIENGAVLIEEGKIVYVGEDKQNLKADLVYDYAGKYVIPGLIDIHIHGCEGAMALDGNPDSIREMAYKLAKHGVTGFLPTGGTLPHEIILKIARAVKEVSKEIVGAKVLGMNSEGPFVNPEKKGAMITGFMRKASIEEVEEIYKESGGLLKIMTIAPEIEGAMEVIRWLAKHDVIPSIGHSNATYEIAMEAFDNGARNVTHLYNAMRSFHHRDPGIIGAAFDRDDVTVELITDGIHVKPAAIRMAIANKGWNNVIIVSDATPLAGLPDGVYRYPGFPPITIKNGKATLPDGTLAGSTLTLDRAIKFLVSIGIPLKRAIQMASTNPARLLGLKKGILKVGYDADITVMDEKFNVLLTIVEGNVVYERKLA